MNRVWLFAAMLWAGFSGAAELNNPPTAVQIGGGPHYGAFSAHLVRTTINRHAFEDWSVLNTTDTAQGYAGFDAKATLNNASPQAHFVGFQSRNIYTGSANLTNYMHGYNTGMVHSGTGTIGTVRGLHIADVGGAGPITVNQGIYIASLTRGASNTAIFSDVGNIHILGGPTGKVQTGIVEAAGFNFTGDAPGKVLAVGYGSSGLVNAGYVDFYAGQATRIVRLSNTGLAVTGFVTADNKISTTAAIEAGTTIKTGSYTYAALPVATNGTVVYCSNCRKVGQGAGAGTGIQAYYSDGAWRSYSTDAVVTQ